MTAVTGRGVRVEVAKTYGSAVTVSAITKASPGVATATSHGLTDGTIGYFSDDLAGMDELAGSAASVSAPATNTFELEQRNTTNFGTFTSGTFTPVTAWSTLSKSTAYNIPNATADELDVTTLLDTVKKTEAGLLAAQNVSIDGLSDAQSEASLIVSAAAEAATAIVVRITLKDGQRRIFRGVPSLPGEQLSKGAVGTSQLTFQTRGRVSLLPA